MKKFIKLIMQVGILIISAVISWGLFTFQLTNSLCWAQGSCSEQAVIGRQPYPDVLEDIFNQASTNQLGNNGPKLPQIYKGYPPEEAKLVPTYIPCVLLKAVAHTESNGWKHFEADYGAEGNTIISSSCDYGLMQINQIHFTNTVITKENVISDPIYNIGTGAYILIKEWNDNLVAYIGDNNPNIVEDWYYTTWAYNEGYVGPFNNPNRNCPLSNPECGTAWNPIRPPFDGLQDTSWYPYQELVWGYAANPPIYENTPLWKAVALTLPANNLITDPPPIHIDTPQPAHHSCTVVNLPIIFKNHPFCSQSIKNGTFEANENDWILGGNTFISDYKAYDGNYSAWFGGYNNAQDTLYQPVTIFTTTNHAVLSYYWYIETEEIIHPWDFLSVQIRDVLGYDLETLEVLDDSNASGTWQFSSFDISHYIGQNIQVYFVGTTDTTNFSSFFVDDVALSVCE